VNSSNADHFISVRFDGTNWEFNTDSDTLGQDWVEFTPQSTDRLVADVDFSADTIEGLEDINQNIDGIAAGFTGDLQFFANQFGGIADAGEFEITGTLFSVDTPPPFVLGDIPPFIELLISLAVG